nr:proline-rich receptor-like protein kinase PERK10 [Equus caballus]XP_023502109.1 proline-rich receptor-like protein kinase PERK10 [Equus caballus]XP_023502110.1 proline-rich receptor-like protein kinase PERK10 [Equus caballus]XP_023502111.1 proline-rich receptor-like protein kinase PERK10 [Equus caballus]XP_023502112.1 proline-rich receptor-like protein kinase PERK10 [Equus caballus]
MIFGGGTQCTPIHNPGSKDAITRSPCRRGLPCSQTQPMAQGPIFPAVPRVFSLTGHGVSPAISSRLSGALCAPPAGWTRVPRVHPCPRVWVTGPHPPPTPGLPQDPPLWALRAPLGAWPPGAPDSIVHTQDPHPSRWAAPQTSPVAGTPFPASSEVGAAGKDTKTMHRTGGRAAQSPASRSPAMGPALAASSFDGRSAPLRHLQSPPGTDRCSSSISRFFRAGGLRGCGPGSGSTTPSRLPTAHPMVPDTEQDPPLGGAQASAWPLAEAQGWRGSLCLPPVHTKCSPDPSGHPAHKDLFIPFVLGPQSWVLGGARQTKGLHFAEWMC